MYDTQKLGYNPTTLKRELSKYYITASQDEIKVMLSSVGAKNYKDLFAHIPDNLKFDNAPNLGEALSYDNLIKKMEELASKNNLKPSFIGDGLKSYKVPAIVPFVSNIRGLATAYTPYQPERSQGTLMSLWLYSSTLSMLTGFEAINASLYERSTCLYEAIGTASRILKNKFTALVLESNYPGDIEVLKTLAEDTNYQIVIVPMDKKTGLTDPATAREYLEEYKDEASSLCFPQVNNVGNLEDVHTLTDLAYEYQIQSIAIFDPMLIATGGLVPPSDYGTEKQGAHIIVGEGQHLAIGPNFGGPGLGIFGIRYNEQNRNSIRSTAGRYVGKGKDASGNDALAMVLSTREQHIRREKASSNICSNEAYIATLAGAAILDRGEKGMSESCIKGKKNAHKAAKLLCQFQGVELAFKNAPFYNEFTLALPVDVDEFISKASEAGLHVGVNVSKRLKKEMNSYLLLSFTDTQTDEDIEKLEIFFSQQFQRETKDFDCLIPDSYLRQNPAGLPDIDTATLKRYYAHLGEQNVSPDENIYPLGSCTMKYNPYINEYAANLPGFTDVHPQAPEKDVQGCLEVTYEIQEYFKKITGLPALTTQPVAGAQGELVGIKLFQAYHRDKGQGATRNIILIPRSAHGTNPATATMAGFDTKKVAGEDYGIVHIEAAPNGEIDFEQLKGLVEKYNTRIAGVMVTNPNTSGIFETKFKEMADLIHSVDGLVYMDGANMNAIAGWINLNNMGVDAVHNNLHKTWSIPHGGGGPGDAIVAVSEKLIDFLPGIQVKQEGNTFTTYTAPKSIGSFHRHYGNFAHKVRCLTYLYALGTEGLREMSGMAVLSAKYLHAKLKDDFPTLPEGAEKSPRMHEFILTLKPEEFDKIAKAGTPKATAIAKVGKLFLDFGLHAPTVAFPEVFGLMIEPTESFTKDELDRFVDVLHAIKQVINETPEVLITTPHFTPVRKVDEVMANKNLSFFEVIKTLPETSRDKITPQQLNARPISELVKLIAKEHRESI